MPEHRHVNRLAGESSPYLLQHAHNPVDWYPWGPEAFERARREDRPIFLSVGYSTCYWCHVMERESFENEAVAEEMNRLFVCIKVDREQRPDVDQLYMTAVQLMTRSGGWPMSVFLTPDGRPFYGGTYFPPGDYAGRPGFLSTLRWVADAWQNRREDINRPADRVLDAIRRLSRPPGAEVALTIDQAFVDNLIGRSVSDYDSVFGGFGGAPKFPQETLLELLLAYAKDDGSERSGEAGEEGGRESGAKGEIRGMVAHTLEAMARGGIRDQLGGGFHRYSTDEKWLVPHFEIMLYDNAMLLGVYAQASGQMGRADFAAVARGIADFVIRDMAGPSGEFYTAIDAEVDGREGASYLWTGEQVGQVLSPAEAVVFNRVYGLGAGANFADPHHGDGTPDANVLYLPMALDEAAKGLGMSEAELGRVLEGMRGKLLAARRLRKQPMLDTKVLTSWNALMIRALAIAGRALGEGRYIHAAEAAAEFLLKNHRDADGMLYRTSRNGVRQLSGFLDDYASLAQALLALSDATGDARWRGEAQAIVTQMTRRFSSACGAMYFTDAGTAEVLVRQVTAADTPLPSGNGSAAMVFLRMDRGEESRRIIEAFADALDQQGEAYSTLVQAAMAYVAAHGAMAVAPADAAGLLERQSQAGVAAVKAQGVRVDANRRRVKVWIAPGYHINGPSVPAGLVPTTIHVAGDAQAQITYPPPTGQLRLPDGSAVDIYEGEISIEIDTASGGHAVLQAQPCSAEACLQAVRIEL